jgi:hypothetical protein
MTKSAKQETSKKAASRWSLGLFRNDAGKLSAVYVSVAGEVVPYLRERVGDRPILFHQVYTGMKYSEARQQLLKDAAKAGIKPEDGPSKAKTTSSGSKAAPKAQRASKAKSDPKAS